MCPCKMPGRARAHMSSTAASGCGTSVPSSSDPMMPFIWKSGRPFAAKSVNLGRSAQLSKQATVRFVDELSEAVDAGTAGAPAKEGLVVLLGPVASIGSTVEVDAERYLSETDNVRLRFRVAATGTEWTANTVVTTGPTST